MTVKPLAQTPRLSHRSAVFAVQLFSLFLLYTSARGEVIVDIEEGRQGEYAINNAVSVEEGWSSPIGYSNVSIAPWLRRMTAKVHKSLQVLPYDKDRAGHNDKRSGVSRQFQPANRIFRILHCGKRVRFSGWGATFFHF